LTQNGPTVWKPILSFLVSLIKLFRMILTLLTVDKSTANKRCEKRSLYYIKNYFLASLVLLMYLPIY
jgi:hypothetical protein